jgi:hypothetical protein
MPANSRGTSPHHLRAPVRTVIASALIVGAIATAGCGSSKPAYCSTRTDLQNAVKGLTSLNFSSGVSGLESQISKIESAATTLVGQAKSDFSSQTQAVESSVDSLTNAVKGLPSNPSAGQIATVAADASKVVSSVKSFTDATKSKCG